MSFRFYSNAENCVHIGTFCLWLLGFSLWCCQKERWCWGECYKAKSRKIKRLWHTYISLFYKGCSWECIQRLSEKSSYQNITQIYKFRVPLVGTVLKLIRKLLYMLVLFKIQWTFVNCQNRKKRKIPVLCLLFFYIPIPNQDMKFSLQIPHHSWKVLYIYKNLIDRQLNLGFVIWHFLFILYIFAYVFTFF